MKSPVVNLEARVKKKRRGCESKRKVILRSSGSFFCSFFANNYLELSCHVGESCMTDHTSRSRL